MPMDFGRPPSSQIQHPHEKELEELRLKGALPNQPDQPYSAGVPPLNRVVDF